MGPSQNSISQTENGTSTLAMAINDYVNPKWVHSIIRALLEWQWWLERAHSIHPCLATQYLTDCVLILTAAFKFGKI